MNWALELHDSEIVGVHHRRSDLIVLVDGLLHESTGEPGRNVGQCYKQMLAVVLAQGKMVGTFDRPDFIDEGVMNVAGEEGKRNLVAFPCVIDRPVELEVRLSSDGRVLLFTGNGLSIQRLGCPEFLEAFRAGR